MLLLQKNQKKLSAKKLLPLILPFLFWRESGWVYSLPKKPTGNLTPTPGLFLSASFPAAR